MTTAVIRWPASVFLQMVPGSNPGHGFIPCRLNDDESGVICYINLKTPEHLICIALRS